MIFKGIDRSSVAPVFFRSLFSIPLKTSSIDLRLRLRLQNGQKNILVPQFEVISVLYRFEFIAANAVYSAVVLRETHRLQYILFFIVHSVPQRNAEAKQRDKKNVCKKNA